jgi:hypothetical protein
MMRYTCMDALRNLIASGGKQGRPRETRMAVDISSIATLTPSCKIT